MSTPEDQPWNDATRPYGDQSFDPSSASTSLPPAPDTGAAASYPPPYSSGQYPS